MKDFDWFEWSFRSVLIVMGMTMIGGTITALLNWNTPHNVMTYILFGGVLGSVICALLIVFESRSYIIKFNKKCSMNSSLYLHHRPLSGMGYFTTSEIFSDRLWEIEKSLCRSFGYLQVEVSINTTKPSDVPDSGMHAVRVSCLGERVDIEVSSWQELWVQAREFVIETVESNLIADVEKISTENVSKMKKAAMLGVM